MMMPPSRACRVTKKDGTLINNESFVVDSWMAKKSISTFREGTYEVEAIQNGKVHVVLLMDSRVRGGGWRVEGRGWRVEGAGCRVWGLGSTRTLNLHDLGCRV